MNLRPSGYEPDELPDCSTPHQEGRAFYKRTSRAAIPGRRPPVARGVFAPLRSCCGTACRGPAPGRIPFRWAQETAAAIFFASTAAASRSTPLAGQPMPRPSRLLGFGMMWKCTCSMAWCAPAPLFSSTLYSFTPVAAITARHRRGSTRPSAAADSSERRSRVSAGSFGTTSVCPSASGLISRNARTFSSSYTLLRGFLRERSCRISCPP